LSGATAVDLPVAGAGSATPQRAAAIYGCADLTAALNRPRASRAFTDAAGASGGSSFAEQSPQPRRCFAAAWPTRSRYLAAASPLPPRGRKVFDKTPRR